MPFDRSAEAKPAVAYTGYLEKFGDVKTSAKGYGVLPYTIKGTRGSQNTRGSLVFMPEFFKPGFTKSQIGRVFGQDKARGITFVHTSNVYIDPKDAKNGQVAALDAFCGSDSTLDELADCFAGNEDWSVQGVASIIKNFFAQLGAVEFGYVVKQQRTKHPDGTKTRSSYTEIDYFFRATEKGVAKQVKRAASKADWLADKQQEIQDLYDAGKDDEANKLAADMENADPLLIGFDTTDFGIVPISSEPSWVGA